MAGRWRRQQSQRRSAEPEPATSAQRDDLTLTPESWPGL